MPNLSPRLPISRLLALCLLCWLGSPAAAGPPQGVPAGPPAPPPPTETVAILKLPLLGVTREIEGLLRTTLREALQRAGLGLLPEPEVEAKLARDASLSSCLSRSCFVRMALVLGVRRVIEGEIQHPQRSTYTVKLQLRDLHTGRFVAAPEEERCEICSTDEARQMISRAATRLSRNAPVLPPRTETADTGTLQVESQPLGAEVLIDGLQQEDRAPATYLLGIGVHSLELRAPGHHPARRPVEVFPGRQQSVNLELVPITPKRPWLTALSGIMLAGAVGLGVGSGILWDYHGKPAYDQADYQAPCLAPQPHCPGMYDNLGPGIATAAAAGALLIGGVVAIYFDYAPPKRRLIVGPSKRR